MAKKQQPANGNQLVTYQQKVTGLRELLGRAQGEIAHALPKHMTAERMLRVVMTTVQRTPALLECSPLSIIGSVVQASQLGLEPDNVLGQAYLVPFFNAKTQQKECQLIPGYRGMVDLSRRTGQLSTIFAKEVYASDDFDFSFGLEPTLTHRPGREPEKDEEIIAVYAVAILRDGGKQFDVMWRREIDAIRARSKAGNSGPWVTDFSEMAKKTVIRRLWKLLPVSVEMQVAMRLDDAVDAGQPQDFSGLLGELPPPPPAALDDLTPRDEPKQDMETAGTEESITTLERMRGYWDALGWEESDGAAWAKDFYKVGRTKGLFDNMDPKDVQRGIDDLQARLESGEDLRHEPTADAKQGSLV